MVCPPGGGLRAWCALASLPGDTSAAQPAAPAGCARHMARRIRDLSERGLDPHSRPAARTVALHVEHRHPLLAELRSHWPLAEASPTT